MTIARYLYALAAIAVGIVDLRWAAFEAAHEPIQAFGDALATVHAIPIVVGAVLVLSGIAMLFMQTLRWGAVGAAAVYVLFAIFWLPRLVTAPQALGLHPVVFIGVFGGIFQQAILAAAAVLLYQDTAAPKAGGSSAVRAAVRLVFALSAICFGLNHFTSIAETAAMVPKWLPPGQSFWAIFTGAAFIAAGIAFAIRRFDVVAARLLAVMFAAFSIFALAPIVLAYPHNEIAWGSSAYNLAAVASAWIFGEWLAQQQQPELHTERAHAAS